MKPRKIIGVFIFNEVELLDFPESFEVYSLSNNNNEQQFQVPTLAEKEEPISARNSFTVLPSHTIKDHPKFCILIHLGGYDPKNQKLKITQP